MTSMNLYIKQKREYEKNDYLKKLSLYWMFSLKVKIIWIDKVLKLVRLLKDFEENKQFYYFAV